MYCLKHLIHGNQGLDGKQSQNHTKNHKPMEFDQFGQYLAYSDMFGIKKQVL